MNAKCLWLYGTLLPNLLSLQATRTSSNPAQWRLQSEDAIFTFSCLFTLCVLHMWHIWPFWVEPLPQHIPQHIPHGQALCFKTNKKRPKQHRDLTQIKIILVAVPYRRLLEPWMSVNHKNNTFACSVRPDKIDWLIVPFWESECTHLQLKKKLKYSCH